MQNLEDSQLVDKLKDKSASLEREVERLKQGQMLAKMEEEQRNAGNLQLKDKSAGLEREVDRLKQVMQEMVAKSEVEAALVQLRKQMLAKMEEALLRRQSSDFAKSLL